MTPEPTPEDLAGWCERYAAIQAAYPVDAERLRLSAAALRSHAGLASRIAAITEAGIAAGYDIRHGNDRGGLTEVGLVQKILADLVAARSEVARLRTELDKWRPLTPAEAEAALDAAEAVPLSEDRIREMVAFATDPANTLPNSDQAQLAATVARLRAELTELRAAKPCGMLPPRVRPVVPFDDDSAPATRDDHHA